jgi:hypothetical protein
MRRVWGGQSAWLFGLLAALATLPAHAADTPTGDTLPSYVSDRFRGTARRVLRQVAVGQIKGACPKNQPLCAPVADSLANAVASAGTGQGLSLQTTLNTFFVNSSTHVLLFEALEPLVDGKESAGLRETFEPLIGCLSGGVVDARREKACRPAREALDKMLAALRSQVRCETPQEKATPDCKAVEELAKRFEARGRIEPANAARVLAALMTSEHFSRPDLRIYLLRLAEVLGHGLDEGLFPPMLAFLSDPFARNTTVQDLAAYDPTQPAPYRLMEPGSDTYFTDALTACGQKLDAFTAWQQARGSGYVSQLRRAVLLGERIDLAPLTGLADYRCAPGGDTKAAAVVAGLVRQSRYLFAPIQVQQVVARHGPPLLAAATLLDYVRTSDTVRFEANLRQLVVYAASSIAVQARTRLRLAEEAQAPAPGVPAPPRLQAVPRLSEAKELCQAQDLLALIAPEQHPRPAPGTPCFDLVTNQQRTVVAWTLDLPASGPTDELRRLRAAALELASRQLQAVLSPPGSADFSLDELNLDDFLRAGRFLVEGKDALARKAAVRTGVDLLVSRVELRATALVGTTAEKCPTDRVKTSIFTGLGAACAASLLIRHAYYPIADFVFEQGFNPGTAGEAAPFVYSELLASPALDSTPLILNVGLGATYVVGREEAWGKGGYGSLTLVDKFGLAFYKETLPSRQFEVGIFAGGFLDALVRTVADTGEEQRSWLLGLTAGWPRLGNTDLGVEVHVGAAMPFSFNQTDRIGFAAGLAAVVPFTAVLGDDDSEE